MSANEHDIQGELRLLHAAVGSAAERLTQTEVGLRSEIELLKIELETLRRFLERHHPDFSFSGFGTKKPVEDSSTSQELL